MQGFLCVSIIKKRRLAHWVVMLEQQQRFWL